MAVSDYMYLMYLCFCCLFWVIFFSHINCLLSWRSAVSQSATFCISYSLWLSAVLLMRWAKLFPTVVSSTLQFFMVFSINFMTTSNILDILRQSIMQTKCFFFVINLRHSNTFFLSRFVVFEDMLISVLKISFSLCSFAASFLFFGEQSVIYLQLIDLLQYFSPKLFCFLVIRLLVWLQTFFPFNFWWNFLSLL